MQYMNASLSGQTLTIKMKGRVDSANAAAVEAELNECRAANASNAVVLDFEDLEYVSSAGLRVILRLRKDAPDLRIVNVGSEVYEILEMTGFTEMIPVEKAYRRLSVQGCEVIGRGANGEVYRLDPDTIIKVYLNPDSLPDIKRERELARRAFVLGIPTAIPYDVVKVGEGYGSVFELLNAKSFAKLLEEGNMDEKEVVRLYVDLLHKIHSTEVLPEDMPDMKEVALRWARDLKGVLPDDKWDKLYRMISDVPVRHTMIHGDYHIKNVMLQNGETLLIDMDTLSQGDPVFEFASVFNAYVGFGMEDTAGAGPASFLGLPRERLVSIWRDTLSFYFNTEDEKALAELEDKAALVGYTRLLRRYMRRHDVTEPECAAIFEKYKAALLGIIDRIDDIILPETRA